MIKARLKKTIVYVASFFLVFSFVAIADDGNEHGCIPIVGGYYDEPGFCPVRKECHYEPRVSWCMLSPGNPQSIQFWVKVCLYYDIEGNVKRIESFGYPPC